MIQSEPNPRPDVLCGCCGERAMKPSGEDTAGRMVFTCGFCGNSDTAESAITCGTAFLMSAKEMRREAQRLGCPQITEPIG